ncbi:MAG: hypothetical protein RR847_01700 [Bacilli bacterium]
MIEKKIIKQINNFKGSVLGIGISEKIINSLQKNNNINLSLMISATLGHDNKKCEKVINIRELRKNFKKKNVDYIIGNVSDIKENFKYFIKDSIYINRHIIYLYGILEDDYLDDLLIKYKRYDVDIEVIKNKNKFLIIINNHGKNNIIKEYFYFIYDICMDFIKICTDILSK